MLGLASNCRLCLPPAAAQLDMLCRGEAVDCYVPQSVMTSDGHVLDVDIVLNEMFKDGDELHVEYSAGPKPFAARQGSAPVWSLQTVRHPLLLCGWLSGGVFGPVLPCEGPAVRQGSSSLLYVCSSDWPSGGETPVPCMWAGEPPMSRLVLACVGPQPGGGAAAYTVDVLQRPSQCAAVCGSADSVCMLWHMAGGPIYWFSAVG